MSPNETRPNGFTLVELMVTIMILGIVVSFAVPSYLGNIRHSMEIQCVTNRKTIERAAIIHYNTVDKSSDAVIPSIEELVSLGYFDTEPKCPNGGVYVWAHKFYTKEQLPQLGCSLHHIPPTP